MFAIEFSINIVVLALLVFFSALVGFTLRYRQTLKYKNKIEELEREILNNYAEILNLERENTGMESMLQDIQSPVIPIKTAMKEEQEESNNQKVPDISLRKKLLSKENLLKQSASGK
ncbi:MAG TPA: hypothetical protein VMI35_04665 [Puia sp.]|nr:hypothetical protein [Puia sp.]